MVNAAPPRPTPPPVAPAEADPLVTAAVAGVVEHARRALPRFELVGREPLPGAAPAALVRWRGVLAGERVEAVCGVYAGARGLVQVTATAPADRFDELEPELRAAVASLQR